jgi:predicted ATP-grasp superfamily ATP-dependent carboligase
MPRVVSYNKWMRIFIYEYTCATVASGQTHASLRAEGRAMLAAIAQDFASVPAVEVITLLHEEFEQENNAPGYQLVRAGDEERACRALAQAADYSFLIAPESGDLLAARCHWVLEVGCKLLGPSLAAVRLTADKLALGRHLQKRGIPTPSCQLLTTPHDFAEMPFPAVLKPRHGAGSQATFLVRSAHELARCAATFKAEMSGDDGILQPFVPGQPASVAFLMGPRQALPLLPATQCVSVDGRFCYQGGTVPLAPELSRRALRAAYQAVHAVPGLQGYVGVDLVLGTASDGSGDHVIEINPRLTTSYLGLRALAKTNLASALMHVVRGEETPPVVWRRDTIAFFADGRVGPSAINH